MPYAASPAGTGGTVAFRRHHPRFAPVGKIRHPAIAGARAVDWRDRAPVEGINNTLKVIKCRAYGYRDEEYFFLKIRAAFPGIPR
ncbi:transposase [Cupriavidus alkaliphilus]|uniref:Transposase n=1 Tax=Cupriavidus alkaliphilus TaxID=942866 RepID=A0A7W4YQM6_9BURK|nr:transposase [Cupriavidus alkaliphilus]